MPELVQGGRLKIDCVSTRGFKPHFWHTGSTDTGSTDTGSTDTGSTAYGEHGIRGARLTKINLLLDGDNGGNCAACKNTAILLIKQNRGSTALGARHWEHGIGSTAYRDLAQWKRVRPIT